MEGGREGSHDLPNDCHWTVTGLVLLLTTRSDLATKREETLIETADEYAKLREMLKQ